MVCAPGGGGAGGPEGPLQPANPKSIARRHTRFSSSPATTSGTPWIDEIPATGRGRRASWTVYTSSPAGSAPRQSRSMTGARSARIAGNGVARAPDPHSRPQGLESFFIEPSLGKAPELPRTGAACRYWSCSYHGAGRASPRHPNLSGSRAVRFRSRVRSAGEAELANRAAGREDASPPASRVGAQPIRSELTRVRPNRPAYPSHGGPVPAPC